MKPHPRILFTIFFLALGLLALALSLDMGGVARMLPLWVSVLTVLLLLVQLMRDIRQGRIRAKGQGLGSGSRAGSGSESSPAPEGSGKPGTTLERRELGALAWIGLFVLLLGSLGFKLAAPLCVLFFFKYRGDCTWPGSLALALGTWLVIQLIFVWLLDLPLPRPLWRL